MPSPAANATWIPPHEERDPAAIPAAGIVLFDGHCNFCSGVVNFLIDRDPPGRLKFAALQSETGRRLLAEHGLPMPDEPDTMVFIEGGRALIRSDAALATTKYLRGLWPLARVGSLVPRFLRDPVYKLVARNRYRWFGRTEACRVPTPAIRARFLD
jgi:predicted DCC family thiol-disulfide oxidoreductase YuxK